MGKELIANKCIGYCKKALQVSISFLRYLKRE